MERHPARALRLGAGGTEMKKGGAVAVVADFEVLEPWPRTCVEDGKFKTFPFNTGGRLIKHESPSLEAPNALVTYVVSDPENSGGVRIRTIVNDNPLPDLAFVAEDTERTVMVSFRASLLTQKANQIELASVDQKPFTLSEVVCWFRQNS